MKEFLSHWLELLGFEDNNKVYMFGAIILIILTSIIIHLILHRIVLRFLEKNAQESEQVWRRALFGRMLFTRLALTLQGVIIYVQANIWIDAESPALPIIETFTQLWIFIYALLAFFSLLDTVEDLAKISINTRKLPLRGIFQSIKIIATAMVIIFSIALLIGKSPLILFSGLGAMTAVLLLIFKDPLLGLVAGIQLSANDMLSVGDWLEMPKFGADGDVIEISLTTVKVRNWDKTITTIPAYSLISDSFINWRGMSESGGRRIKRAINIDTSSVGFLNEEDISRLRNAKLLTDYIKNKLEEIEAYNKEVAGEPGSPMNLRRLTNLGTFRAYLVAYLKAHQNIHQHMTQIVRQLEPGNNGVPLQVYAFSNDTNWVTYEGIQSDIFDHIFAVVPEFGLRIHQSPSGYDLQQLGKNLHAVLSHPPAADSLSKPELTTDQMVGDRNR